MTGSVIGRREEVLQLVSFLFGWHAREDFRGMPVTEVGQYSLMMADSLSARVVMAEGASVLDWLHETAHYFCWLWFQGLRKDELTHGETVRAEVAAYLPIVALELGGSPAAKAWLDAAYPTVAARARKMGRDNQDTMGLKEAMRSLIDG